MLIYQDRVKETTTTTGTGTLTLAGAATGYRTFGAALANADVVTFCTEDGTNWEIAEGAFTTSGTTLARTTIIASSNSGSAVNWGAGTKNVFLTVSARDVHPDILRYGAHGSTGCLAATFPRYISKSVSAGAATSGTLRLHQIILPRGLPVTNISFWTGSTALGTGSNQWFGLFDADRNVLAKTADDTSTAWGASTKKTLAVTGGPFVTTYAGVYYVGILVVATTMPTIESLVAAQATGAVGAAPILAGNSTVSLTTPASCTGQQTAITSLAQYAYAELS